MYFSWKPIPLLPEVLKKGNISDIKMADKALQGVHNWYKWVIVWYNFVTLCRGSVGEPRSPMVKDSAGIHIKSTGLNEYASSSK